MKATLQLNPVSRILRDKGVAPGGAAQRFHTANVLRRIVKYIPYRTGATVKLTISQTDMGGAEIVTEAPYAAYLYYGMAMAGRAPKTVTDRPLNYTKAHNPQAGPYWDRVLAGSEGAAIAADLQRYMRRR